MGVYRTGVNPKQNYESNIIGASPEHIRKMRSNTLLCIPPVGTQPCAATTIRWKISKEADPAWLEPVTQVKNWIQIWNQAQPPKEIREA